MIPKIFEKTVTSFDDENALGSLPDCVSCYVIEERNGEYSLTLTYPLNGTNADLISNRRIITAKPSPYRDPQPFRIRKKSISKIGGLMTVYAEHISYDLNGYTFNMTEQNENRWKLTYLSDLIAMLNYVDSPFTFYTDGVATVQPYIYFTVNTPKTLRDMCSDSTGSILDLQTTSGGQLKDNSTWLWDNYKCTLCGGIMTSSGALPWRGRDTLLDLEIVLGKNMSSISAQYDNSDCYTHVKATTNNCAWLSTVDKQNYDGNISSIYPDITGDEEVGSMRIKCIDTNEELDKTTMTMEEMYARMKRLAYQEYRQLKHEPSWSISVGYEDLNKAIGYRVWDASSNKYQYKDKAADLCDTVMVTYPPLGLVRERSYISKIKTDVIHERYAEITVGELSTALSRTLSRWR